jgi:VanZ family protein
MIHLIKRYWVSALLLLAIFYLSLFRSPSTGLSLIPHLDKYVHLLMYFLFSGVLWVELLRNRLRSQWKEWGIAFGLPAIMGGVIELLQSYCTTYRSGDWFDFLFDLLGILLAGLIIHFFIRPRFIKEKD